MNEKQVSFEDFRKEQKKRERKEKLYNGVKKCTDWNRNICCWCRRIYDKRSC